MRGTFLVSMRYSIMIPPGDPQKKITGLKELVARTEERMRKLQAKAEPGTARMVHALTNSIRKHRRELQKLVARQPDVANQKHLQQRQMQQVQRDAPADRSGELPAKQDQEPRKPGSQQGAAAGQ